MSISCRITVGAILAVLAAFSSSSSSQPVTPAGCPSSCGEVTIPYPFGLSEDCYLNPSFLITCNDTFSPPKPFLRKSNIEVANISLEGELRIYTYVGSSCKNNQSGDWTTNSTISKTQLSSFSFSTTKNRFTAVGCDTLATVTILNGDNSSSGCLSMCNNYDSVSQGSCDGFGCCQTAIPKNIRNYTISVGTYRNLTDVWVSIPCSHVFIAEEASFKFSKDNLTNMQPHESVPTVVDWAVWNETCAGASEISSSYACKADNSLCYDPQDINGYRCNCSQGYRGNPYMTNGCQDINECVDPNDNECEKICVNTPGNYTCSCPGGFHGDGRRSGEGCIRNESLVVKITVGVSAGIIVLLFFVGFLYFWMKRRNLIRLKEKYFKQNGGLLLQQQLGNGDASTSSNARIFTAEELKKATGNYNESRIVGRGGYGTVYKGISPNKTVVAIKKSKQVDPTQVQQFVNEVTILSQINHRNVVKLLGCCLETEVPLLVYEFVSNGTLFDHIHGGTKMSWETRLRIAAETAGVLSYLHSAASIPIIHRDIKSTNILLDENYVAKVSDFGASRLVPLDQAEMSTLVQGTLGYLDPEYLRTSTLTEKSDVYSFGVVLVELLTGKMVLSFDKPEEERCLAMYFLSSLKEGRLFQIVEDSNVKSDDDAQQVKEVAMLSKRCLRMRGDERPTMKEVAMKLEGIRVMAQHPWVAVELNHEETHNLLGEAFKSLDHAYTSTTNESMMDQLLPSMSGGR
ncbi:hypothetical protein SAY86_014604 [Trapa natans]|uniref:Uncharacterized protein n=1 Tax=Trapa natans TaxID=22666 RepID=A0AAN7KLH7_TRANT|nr:hypothetical protein SAY86_014604 [Trapa natans]